MDVTSTRTPGASHLGFDTTYDRPLRRRPVVARRRRSRTVPRPFGDYDLHEELGRGTFGIVYRAWHHPLRRFVALKVLVPSAMPDPHAGRRLHREASAVARLHHPNVVTVHATGTVHGCPYIDMELVDGETLATFVTRESPIPLNRAIAILRQVASALDHAHARRLVHRDVKPGNVLVDVRGRAVLTDFGLAHPVPGMREGPPATLHNGAGTWPYLAPEQVAGRVPGPAADRYALGVTAFEILSGSLPAFAAPLGALRPDLPIDARRAVSRMLAPEPASRFPTCEAFVDALAGATT